MRLASPTNRAVHTTQVGVQWQSLELGTQWPRRTELVMALVAGGIQAFCRQGVYGYTIL